MTSVSHFDIAEGRRRDWAVLDEALTHHIVHEESMVSGEPS
ncbi:hypothetical protein SJ05684_c36470 [Sinorhizobium sojae CCBAU 05684]|uniref:Uncharacterized protein n=1 Tax=Sinorhizobium sojae CCBAU 05684 TaxID=716928 RepID=A0A249PGG7_9HYPH|nr:hypothetical protein SJ05684_c36470 [Sinorhizobium sojae CCBAU 05684]